jgi:hypothetical protein
MDQLNPENLENLFNKMSLNYTGVLCMRTGCEIFVCVSVLIIDKVYEFHV